MPARRILIIRLPCHKVYPAGPVYLLSAIHAACPGAALHLLDLALVAPRETARAMERSIRELSPDLVAFSWRDVQIFSPQDVDGALRDAFIVFHDPSLLRKARAALRGLRDMAALKSVVSANLRLLRRAVRRFPRMGFALGGPSVRIFGDQFRRRLPARVQVFSEAGLDGFFQLLGLPAPANPLEPEIDMGFLEGAFLSWQEYAGEIVSIQTKQGCPHECLYCLYGFLEGRNVRHRETSRVVAEMEGYVKRWGVRRFWFADAQLLSVPRDHIHLEEILRGVLSAGLSVRWSGYLRVHELDRPLADLMVQTGLEDLEVSLTSGSQKIVDRLRLGFRVSEVMRGLHVLRDAGYAGKVILNLSLNAPGEDAASLQETIAAVREVDGIFGADRVVPVIFFLAIQPRTGLEEAALRAGHIRPGYNPLSVLPWNVLRLIYNPPPLGSVIGRACARVFSSDGRGETPGRRILAELEAGPGWSYD